MRAFGAVLEVTVTGMMTTIGWLMRGSGNSRRQEVVFMLLDRLLDDEEAGECLSEHQRLVA